MLKKLHKNSKIRYSQMLFSVSKCLFTIAWQFIINFIMVLIIYILHYITVIARHQLKTVIILQYFKAAKTAQKLKDQLTSNVQKNKTESLMSFKTQKRRYYHPLTYDQIKVHLQLKLMQ